MQHPLVDAQRPLQQAGARGGAVGGVDQAPTAQRAARGDRRPVGVRQRGQRQPEGGGAVAGVGDVGVDLGAGAQQQDVPLEGGQAEASDHAVQGKFPRRRRLFGGR